MKKDLLIEIILLVIVFGTLFYIGPGSVFRHQLSNTYPLQYAATDGFLYMMLSEWVYDTGNYRYNPPYSVEGFTDSIAYHPPVFMQLSAVFAHTAGLNSFDATSLLLGLAILAGAFTFYMLIRGYNKKVALASLPLLLFLFVRTFPVGYTWGEALLLMGSYFFIVLLLILANLDRLGDTWSIVILGIVWAASVLTHTVEAAFFLAFIILYLAFTALLRQKGVGDLKKAGKVVLLALLIMLVLSFNYLVIFANGYLKLTGGAQVTWTPVSPDDPGAIRSPKFTEFTLLSELLIVIGAFLAFMLAMKKAHPALLAAPFMLVIGMLNWIGWPYRAFQTRFLWPIYLSVLFGICIYLCLKHVLKQDFFTKHGTLIIAIISLTASAAIVFFLYTPVVSGAMYPEQYNAFRWIDQNTPTTAKVMFFYGDGYSQSGRILKRPGYHLQTDEYAKFNNATRMYRMEAMSVGEMRYIYRPSFFDFKYHMIDLNISEVRQFDICSFDYYVLDMGSAYFQQIQQVHLAIRQLLMQHNFTEEYHNNLVSVLKNPHPGGECLA